LISSADVETDGEMADLRLVLVTPETTLLDTQVSTLRFPMFDGQIGILPGRLPLVGRLGYGELVLTTDQGTQEYFIDGGFVQVKQGVVSILTSRSMPVSEITTQNATQEMESASGLPTQSVEEREHKDRAVQRARSLVAIARKPR